MNSVKTSLALLNMAISTKAEELYLKATKPAYDKRRKRDGFYTRDEQLEMYRVWSDRLNG